MSRSIIMVIDSEQHDAEAEPNDLLISYQEPIFELIGPQLHEQALFEIHEICQPDLDQAQVLDRLQTLLACFPRLAVSLYQLEQQHASGQEIHIENGEVFSQFSATYAQDLVQAQVAEYFCQYLHTQLEQMHKERHLGTLILRFDEAFYLFSALDELLNDSDCQQYFYRAFSSQNSFLEWKDFIVAIAQQSQCDEPTE